jgi:hypothetical protein
LYAKREVRQAAENNIHFVAWQLGFLLRLVQIINFVLLKVSRRIMNFGIYTL